MEPVMVRLHSMYPIAVNGFHSVSMLERIWVIPAEPLIIPIPVRRIRIPLQPTLTMVPAIPILVQPITPIFNTLTELVVLHRMKIMMLTLLRLHSGLMGLLLPVDLVAVTNTSI